MGPIPHDGNGLDIQWLSKCCVARSKSRKHDTHHNCFDGPRLRGISNSAAAGGRSSRCFLDGLMRWNKSQPQSGFRYVIRFAVQKFGFTGLNSHTASPCGLMMSRSRNHEWKRVVEGLSHSEALRTAFYPHRGKGGLIRIGLD